MSKIFMSFCALAMSFSSMSLAFAQSNGYLHKGDWNKKEGEYSSMNSFQLDPRIRAYSYSPDVVFNLPITVGLHTHIVVGDDEEISETPILGETIQWRVTGNEKNLYIKALKAGAVTSFTFVTTKRIYQMELRSTSNPDLRVQKVYFEYPSNEANSVHVTLNKDKKQIREAFFKVEKDKNDFEAMRDASFKNSKAYKVNSTGPFVNTEIYDDGTRTFIRMPEGVQDLPAVFTFEDGILSPINYSVEGRSEKGSRDVLVLERRSKEWVLKIGKDQVKITKN